MKLLFDLNLSFRLCQRLKDVFPDSNQVRVLGMDEDDDRQVWAYAKANDFIIVTQDADFADLSLLHGPPKSHLAPLRQSTDCRHRETTA